MCLNYGRKPTFSGETHQAQGDDANSTNTDVRWESNLDLEGAEATALTTIAQCGPDICVSVRLMRSALGAQNNAGCLTFMLPGDQI